MAPVFDFEPDGTQNKSMDPDEQEMERRLAEKDPAYRVQLLEAIEVHLRYGFGALKIPLYLIAVLLCAILYKLWSN